MSPGDRAGSMARLALGGAIWSGLGQWGASLIGLATFAVTARLLGPEIFGLNALAASVVGFGGIFVSGVLTEALTQRAVLSDEERRAGFWLCLPIGFVTFVLTAALAPLFGAEMRIILPVLSVTLLLNALAAAPMAMLMRDMRFKAISAIDLVATAVSSAVGITLAIAGAGVLSLILMEVVRVLLRTIGGFRASGYRPGGPPPFSAIRSIASFGAGGLLLMMVATVQMQVPRLAIGFFLGEAALGIFAMASRITAIFSGLVLGPLSSVALSVSGRLQEDLETLRTLLLGSLKLMAALAVPGFLGLAAISPVLIPLVFGSEWEAAILPTQMLLLLGIRLAATSNTVAVLRGVGRTRAPVLVQTAGLVITLALTPLGLAYGVPGMVGILMVRSLATWPMGAWLLHRAIGVGFWDQLRAGARPTFAAVVMAGLVSTGIAFSPPTAQSWLVLCVVVPVGVALYGALLALLDRRLFAASLTRIQAVRKGSDRH